MTFGTSSTLPDWLNRQADSNGNKVAIDHEDGALTYAELRTLAGKLATSLADLGMHKGDRVALIAKNGRLFGIALHALMQLGAILVPVNWRLTAPEIAWQLNDAGVEHVLHDEACGSQSADVALHSKGALQLHQLEKIHYAKTIDVVRTHICLSDIHALVYTSGTTGFPKGTMISYGNHWWSATASALQLGLNEADRWLIPMPLFHVGGMAVLMRSLIYGTTAVVHDGFQEECVLRALTEHRITIASFVPTMLQRIVQHLPSVPFDSELRCVLLGGSSIPRPLLEACQVREIPVASSYGLTEANSQVTTLPPHDSVRKFGSAGRPLMPTEVKIHKDGRHENGYATGEICVRGPSITPGYWHRPDATSEALQNEWLHTGDIGYLDDDGYLYILDRRNDLIVSGGENIYPAEVESVLLSHPSVNEAGVVGNAHETWGHVPVAFVVVKDGEAFDPEELSTYCKEHLAGYKVPRAIRQANELPRNASGKLLRRTLKTWLTH